LKGLAAGEVWELWLEDGDCNPVHRVTLLTLGRALGDRFHGERATLARCVVLESSAEDAWPPGDVGDWGFTDFERSTARRLA